MANLKQHSIGLLIYSVDYDDLLPPATIWKTVANFYIGPPRFSAKSDRGKEISAMFFDQLSGKNLATLKDSVNISLVFEADRTGPNLAGGRSSLPSEPYFREGFALVFADGHSKRMPLSQARQLRWSLDIKSFISVQLLGNSVKL